MSAVRPSVICDRVRTQVSLELDGELSQLERALLAAHLVRCADCRSYEAEATAFTRVLREAPLERIESPVVVRRPRRAVAARLQAGVAAAALALVVVGFASRLASPESERTALFPSASGQIQFPSQRQLERELAILDIVRPGKPISPAGPGGLSAR